MPFECIFDLNSQQRMTLRICQLIQLLQSSRHCSNMYVICKFSPSTTHISLLWSCKLQGLDFKKARHALQIWTISSSAEVLAACVELGIHLLWSGHTGIFTNWIDRPHVRKSVNCWSYQRMPYQHSKFLEDTVTPAVKHQYLSLPYNDISSANIPVSQRVYCSIAHDRLQESINERFCMSL